MLIGTCLIIIIPEGVETLYSANTLADSCRAHPRQVLDEWATGSDPNPELPSNSYEANLDMPGTTHREPHAYIGLSIIVGFIMMYLIDRLPKHAAGAGSVRAKSRYISLADLGGRRSTPATALASIEEAEGANGAPAPPQSPATTIGLVIHAAADGIALAASSFISENSTGFIVFLAIMIHKAPAAFGLTSVLIKQGFTKRQARAHLVVFSLAAPVGALATWVLVTVLAGGQIEGEEGTKFATGLLLLFSAGTFL